MRLQPTSLFITVMMAFAPPAVAADGEANHTIDQCLAQAGHEVHPENDPVFQFRLQADGRVADVDLVVPSGDSDFDPKALACMRDLRVDGKPPGDRWLAFVGLMWLPGPQARFTSLWVVPPPPPGKPVRPLALGNQLCPPKIRPGEWGEPAKRVTALAFRVTVDGTVIDPKVAQSSGRQELDDTALACAATWRFRPAMLDGKPVEVPFGIAITWYKP